MGAPDSGMKAAERPDADELLSAFRTISPAERRRHAAVLDYWLSIRGDKEFPPLHDLDPLELSDAGPSSMLLELISGGHDAEVRHLGDALKPYVSVDSVIEAPDPSLLACLAKKLPIVAISRDFIAFEDEFAVGEGSVRCWVTLLPLSAGGAWVDYVYALVSFEAVGRAEPAKKPAKKAEPQEAIAEAVEEPVAETAEEPVAEIAEEPAPETAEEPVAETAEEPAAETVEEPVVEEVEEPIAEIAEEPIAEEVEEPLAETPEEPAEAEAQVEEGEVEEPVEIAPPPEAEDEAEEPVAAVEEPVCELEEAEVAEQAETAEAAEEAAAPKASAGFSKLFDSLAGLTGFYGSQPVKLEPVIEAADEPTEEAVVEEPVAEEPIVDEAAAEESPVEEAAADEQPAAELVAEEPKHPAPASEGTLQSKLTEVRAKADEARQARLRATAALYEGLSAAYDFAIDAEDAPEEYLRLVEAQGLKIQLRSPMKPVVKLAFADTCDEATIKQLEAVLAWALKEELPRGSLLEKLEAAGGVAGVLKEAA